MSNVFTRTILLVVVWFGRLGGRANHPSQTVMKSLLGEFESESELHEKVIVKVKGQLINFIVDTGSSSMIMTKQAYLELINNNNEMCLTETKVKLTPYGSNESLKLLGKFKTLIEYEDKQIDETIYVIDTSEKQRKCSLSSKNAAESLGIITFNIDRQTVVTVEQNEKQISLKLQNILTEYDD